MQLSPPPISRTSQTETSISPFQKPLATTVQFSVSMNLTALGILYKWHHPVFILLYLVCRNSIFEDKLYYENNLSAELEKEPSYLFVIFFYL